MERTRRHDPLSSAAIARLVFALMLSLALHAALLIRIEQGPRQPELRSIVRARLIAAPPEPAVPPVAAPRTFSRKIEAAGRASPPVQERQVTEVSKTVAADASSPEPSSPPVPISLPVDLNYYSSAELDVYPYPAQAITPELEAIPGGWIRILTSIGETGQVDDAVVFDAQPADIFDAPALSAVRSTRFHPARRDGRAVRSRVLIELRVPDNSIGGAA